MVKSSICTYPPFDNIKKRGAKERAPAITRARSKTWDMLHVTVEHALHPVVSWGQILSENSITEFKDISILGNYFCPILREEENLLEKTIKKSANELKKIWCFEGGDQTRCGIHQLAFSPKPSKFYRRFLKAEISFVGLEIWEMMTAIRAMCGPAYGLGVQGNCGIALVSSKYNDRLGTFRIFLTAIRTLCGLAYRLGVQGNCGIAFVRLSKFHDNLYIV
ncbi:hypothetical protein Scep_012543 [Stephania cephalantha]|uniref:Uncharacterized protein n=1 Tax=Stephania cephalantha TaxID=152367 RepID=A0AAP0P9M8_9MAGN